MNYADYNGYEQRTAGHGAGPKTVQAWKTKKSAYSEQAQNKILNNLEKASRGQIGRFDTELETALSYAPQKTAKPVSTEAFQFGDVIDVVNPLQHLPVINMIYRGMTGDEAHPMAQIIGGALYGGPVGAISGTVNAIAKVQTGHDMGGHVLKMMGGFTGFKADISTHDAASHYKKIDLDSMPDRGKIRSITLNS